MLKQIDLQRILFLDIETVSAYPNYAEMPEVWQNLWADKTKYQREKEEKTPEEFYPERAGILAEFGKIVCISCGLFSKYGIANREFRLKSFYGDDEKILLEE